MPLEAKAGMWGWDRLKHLTLVLTGDGAPRPPADPADPNAPYIFQPAPAADNGEGVVTLDQLYHLSRLL